MLGVVRERIGGTCRVRRIGITRGVGVVRVQSEVIQRPAHEVAEGHAGTELDAFDHTTFAENHRGDVHLATNHTVGIGERIPARAARGEALYVDAEQAHVEHGRITQVVLDRNIEVVRAPWIQERVSALRGTGDTPPADDRRVRTRDRVDSQTTTVGAEVVSHHVLAVREAERPVVVHAVIQVQGRQHVTVAVLGELVADVQVSVAVGLDVANQVLTRLDRRIDVPQAERTAQAVVPFEAGIDEIAHLFQLDGVALARTDDAVRAAEYPLVERHDIVIIPRVGCPDTRQAGGDTAVIGDKDDIVELVNPSRPVDRVALEYTANGLTREALIVVHDDVDGLPLRRATSLVAAPDSGIEVREQVEVRDDMLAGTRAGTHADLGEEAADRLVEEIGTVKAENVVFGRVLLVAFRRECTDRVAVNVGHVVCQRCTRAESSGDGRIETAPGRYAIAEVDRQLRILAVTQRVGVDEAAAQIAHHVDAAGIVLRAHVRGIEGTAVGRVRHLEELRTLPVAQVALGLAVHAQEVRRVVDVAGPDHEVVSFVLQLEVVVIRFGVQRAIDRKRVNPERIDVIGPRRYPLTA